MKRECVVWSACFVPSEDFLEYIESLGYNIHDFIRFGVVGEMNFDPEIVQYVKDHADWNAWGDVEYAMKGTPSSEFKIGFLGAAYILEIDTDKTWQIRLNDRDVPYVKYITVKKTEYGQIYWED